jgi:phosphoenolpyruvate synthase/pyruvate phosphate dikinase
MPELENRLKFEYAPDYGGIRPIRNILIDLLQMDHHKFIKFYEDIYINRDVPHYELAIGMDTIVLASIAIIATFLSPIVGSEYDRWRRKAKKDNDIFSAEDLKELLDLFKYLIRALALRDAYYNCEISRSEFRKLKQLLEYQPTDTGKNATDTIGKIDEIWRNFNINKIFSFGDKLFKELSVIAAEEIRRPIKKGIILEIRRNKVRFTLHGVGVSPGYAHGLITEIHSPDDIGKIKKGDIGVFDYYNPDLAHALTNCAGSIGLFRCGGRLGHLAIVSREIGIPCIVGVTQNPYLEDATEVTMIVDGRISKIVIYGQTN